MLDKLFGIDRPEQTCQARIEVKLPPLPGQSAAGRPFKVWTGPSDTDEATIQYAICQNQVLAKLIRARKLAPDGFYVLQGRLTYFDAAQVFDKYDVEIDWVQFDGADRPGGESDFAERLFERYSQALKDIRAAHAQSIDGLNAHHTAMLAKMSEHYALGLSKMSEGLGKVSESARDLATFTKEVSEDRKQVTLALIKAVSTPSAAPAASASSPIDSLHKVLSMVRGIADLKAGIPPRVEQATASTGFAFTKPASQQAANQSRSLPPSSQGGSIGGPVQQSLPGLGNDAPRDEPQKPRT